MRISDGSSDVCSSDRNNGIYRGTDVNPSGGADAAITAFVKGARYDKMMEGFGGVGVNVTSPDELNRAVSEALDSGRPTLINAVIDEKAGTESGRIGNLNPQSVVRSEEHTSELQSLMRISYAVFCLKKTKMTTTH